MLNPNAHAYTPASSFPPEPSRTDRPNTSKKNRPKKTNTKPETTNAKKNVKTEAAAKKNNVKTEVKKSETKKNVRPKEQSRRKSSSQQLAVDPFEKESKFITIEAAIDPVHRLENVSGKPILLEHGYERYIDWVRNSRV